VVVTFSAAAGGVAWLDDVTWLEEVPEVERVSHVGSRVEVVGHGAVLARVGAALVDRGYYPTDLAVQRATLEDVFLRLTQS
jgi:hypothetical protein